LTGPAWISRPAGSTREEHVRSATSAPSHLLAALRRHLSPGGAVLVTLHGPGIIPRLRETGYGQPPGAPRR
jgi:hypothetical protein